MEYYEQTTANTDITSFSNEVVSTCFGSWICCGLDFSLWNTVCSLLPYFLFFKIKGCLIPPVPLFLAHDSAETVARKVIITTLESTPMSLWAHSITLKQETLSGVNQEIKTQKDNLSPAHIVIQSPQLCLFLPDSLVPFFSFWRHCRGNASSHQLLPECRYCYYAFLICNILLAACCNRVTGRFLDLTAKLAARAPTETCCEGNEQLVRVKMW